MAKGTAESETAVHTEDVNGLLRALRKAMSRKRRGTHPLPGRHVSGVRDERDDIPSGESQTEWHREIIASVHRDPVC